MPPADGGRLLAFETLNALASAGVEVTLVAPADAGVPPGPAHAAVGRLCRSHLITTRPRPFVAAFLASLAGGPPYSIGRHRLGPLRRAVAALLDRERFDVVHAEQLQSFAQAAPALSRRLPVVLRAQNVESDLWAATAVRRRFARPWLRRQATQLATWEARAVRLASTTLALTPDDAARLTALAGGGEVEVVPAPFPERLPAADAPLVGQPPLVVLSNAAWYPNREAAEWLVRAIWPEIRRRVPSARLHIFGDDRSSLPHAGVDVHPAPVDSRSVFGPGSVLVVPLRIASGVRMKILEAWARGVPVIATPKAALGLGAEGDRELLLADDAEGFARAVDRLVAEPRLAERLVAAGRRHLAEHHAPERVAAGLVAAYRRAAERA